MQMHPDLKEYLPDPCGSTDHERLPEREFFYKVFYKLHPETVESLVKQAQKERTPAAVNLQEQQWQMQVQPEWMDELLQNDFVSSKYTSFCPDLFCAQPRRAEASAAC
jgi:hypothetical protein